jgi:glycine hydroxymethyltransferase
MHHTVGQRVGRDELSISDWLALVGMDEDDYRAIPSVVRELAAAHGTLHRSALNLVASHNYLGPLARLMLSSPFAEHVMAGEIGKRSHGGGDWVDRLDAVTVALARSLFGAASAEYRAMSGAISNGIALAALCKAGDVVYALPVEFGGHRTHREDGYSGLLGLNVRDIPCEETGEIDMAALAREVANEPPRLIIVGTADLQFPYPIEELSRLARSVGADVLYDGAHVLGLVAGRQFQDPLGEGATVLTGSTQKTLGGPIGGLVLTNSAELGERVAEKTSALISNYQNNRVAALAIALAEMGAFGQEYASEVVANANHLSQALAARGIPVVTRGGEYTHSHIVMIDGSGLLPGHDLVRILEAGGVLVSAAPHAGADSRARGLRLGTAAVTRRGMGQAEMEVIADCMSRILIESEAPVSVAVEVEALTRRFPAVRYCFAG